MRGRVRARQEGRAGGDRLARALRRRLGGREHGFEAPQVAPTGKKVAVVGAGPGGLTVAGELARLGHEVHVFEALHDTGGVLRYGIPEFRLPKHIVDTEVDNLRRLGVEVECDVIIGRTLTDPGAHGNDFDAVFVANGAGLPMFLNIPGENLKGVYSANEYLTRVNLMGAYMYYEGVTPIARGERVLVFGGGNVAMDAVRTAKRLGAEQAICAYRRTARRDAGPHRGDRPRRAGGHRLPVPARAAGDPRRRAGLGAGRDAAAHGARRARRFGPPPAGAGARQRVRDGLRRGRRGPRHGRQPAAHQRDTGDRAQQVGQHRHRRDARDLACPACSPAATSCAAAPPSSSPWATARPPRARSTPTCGADRLPHASRRRAAERWRSRRPARVEPACRR